MERILSRYKEIWITLDQLGVFPERSSLAFSNIGPKNRAYNVSIIVLFIPVRLCCPYVFMRASDGKLILASNRRFRTKKNCREMLTKQTSIGLLGRRQAENGALATQA